MKRTEGHNYIILHSITHLLSRKSITKCHVYKHEYSIIYYNCIIIASHFVVDKCVNLQD